MARGESDVSSLAGMPVYLTVKDIERLMVAA